MPLKTAVGTNIVEPYDHLAAAHARRAEVTVKNNNLIQGAATRCFYWQSPHLKRKKRMDCIFCKIIKNEIPVEIIYKDDLVIAFRDVKPIAPVHILIIPKKHIESIVDLQEKHEELVGRMIMTAKKLADKAGISQNGYKLLFRVGHHGGQEVPHIHLHLIGGAPLSENIRPITGSR